MRQATIDDEELLIRLRVDFMGVMGHPADGGALYDAIRAYVGPAMNSGLLDALLVEDTSGNTVANGWAVYIQKAPHPHNLSGMEGYLLNIYTDPVYRGRGIASAITGELVALCRRKGAGCVRLIASSQGKPVYEGLGFTPDEGAMRLTL